MTSSGDPHHPLHDDYDYDGDNDEENQQQLLHLVGEKMGDDYWSTISVGRETYLRLYYWSWCTRVSHTVMIS